MKISDEFAGLKTLEPPNHDIDPGSAPAQAMLERVLAADPGDGVRPRRRLRKTVIRVAVAAAAVAAVAAILIPRQSGPSLGGDAAYASWTAQPSGVSAQDRAKIAGECRKRLKGTGYDNKLDHAGTSMVDRRGDWVLAFLVGQNGFEASCMINIASGRFGPGSGAIGDGVATPRRRQLIPSGMGVSGGGQFPYLTQAVGQAGSDIVGMTYQSPNHGTITATVSDGHFAFWLPGSEFDGLHPVPVRITYRDGTTANVKLTLGG
ncbi:hypothetical protein AB0E69_02560 [Kribbella sp. NPDC026611]|uniref:hypothetical protein n=1 Tax=Kribbella sp. NPDC026611 TaxID=3154911 RepID=UPI0033E430DD